MSCGRLSRASDAWRAKLDAAHKGGNAIFVQPLSISMSGIIRQDSQVIPQYGTAYIAALFRFENQGASLEAPNNISLKGKCNEIKVANVHPSLLQVFDTSAINASNPKSLRSEINNGTL